MSKPLVAPGEDDNILYPCVVVLDRYSGAYSGGVWTAFNRDKAPKGCRGDDTECDLFWAEFDGPAGVGDTPNRAVRDLAEQLALGTDNE